MKHLEDHEIAAALAGAPLESSSDKHLAECLACRQQVTELEALISERRESLETEVPDWEEQRRAVLARLGDPPAPALRQSHWRRALLAAAAVVLVAIGVRELTVPRIPTVPGVENEIQIEEILAEVEAVLSDDSLPGFESIDPGFDDPENMISNGSS